MRSLAKMVLIIFLCLAAVTVFGLVVAGLLDSAVAGILAAVAALISLLVMAWKRAGRKQRELERRRPYRGDTGEDGSL